MTLALLLAGAGRARAQDSTIVVDGTSYGLVDGSWYNFSLGFQGDRVAPERIILRLQSGATPSSGDLSRVGGSNGLAFGAALPGDYHVLQVDTTARDPFVVAADVAADAYFESVHFDGLGRLMDFDPNDPDDPLWNTLGIDIDGDGNKDGQYNLREIRMPEAWGLTTGDSTVILAVLDTQADFRHPDLRDNLWMNLGEDANGDGIVEFGVDENGVDDDGNGYIDDLFGWDFDDENIQADPTPGDNDPTPDPVIPGTTLVNDHGTATAGVALARTDNGIGLAGVAGGNGQPGSGVRYMPVAHFSFLGDPLDPDSNMVLASSVGLGIDYASRTGADVVVMSFGFINGVDYDEVRTAVEDADARGTVMVAAVGNIRRQSGSSPLCDEDYAFSYYPAAYEPVIAVGATIPNGKRWRCSSVGNPDSSGVGTFQLDVMAPGGRATNSNLLETPRNVITTDVRGRFGRNPLSGTAGNYLDGIASLDYLYGGTSASAPHVAGVAALIRSLNPSLSPAEVRFILRETADPGGCDASNPPSVPPLPPGLGYEDFCGHGRVDAYAALRYTLVTYGGRPQADLIIPEGETWDFGAVTVSFAPGAELIVDGTLNATGTTFTEAEAGQGWGGIAVYEDATLDLDFATVSEAAVGVAVFSTNVTITGSEIVENGTGIESGFTLDYDCVVSGCPGAVSTTRSAFTLTESCVIQSEFDPLGPEGYGLWVRHAGVQITRSTIEANDAYGLFLDEADVSAYKLLLTNNGGGSSSSPDGARILPGGDLTLTSYFSGGGSEGSQSTGTVGLNSIRDNAEDEIGIVNGGYAYIGDICGITDCPESNRVSENGFPSDGDFLIDNESSTDIVKAIRTYWATTPPDPPDAAFGNPAVVEDLLALTSDPASDAGRPGGCTLSGAREGANSAMRGEGGLSAESGTELTPEDAAWLRARLGAMRTALVADPAAEDGAALVHRLYALQRLDRADVLGEHVLTMDALAETYASLAAGGSLEPAHRATAEAALVASVHDALRGGHYDRARALLAEFEPHVEQEGTRRVLDLAAVTLDEQDGHYADALARLDAVIAGLGPEETQLARDLEAVAAQIEARRAGQGERVAGSEATEPVASVSTRGATETALLPSFPNPTRERAAVRLSLADAADVAVAVYDVLGRRVAVLHEGDLGAGRHRLAFDGRTLPSGVYLVRAVVHAEGTSPRALTQRLTLLR